MASRLALDVVVGTGVRRRYVARAHSLVDGRLVATRAMAPSAARAAEMVAERLLRQIRRAAGADIALGNEPRVIEGDLRDLTGERRPPPPRRMKPAEERAIVPRHTYAPGPEPTVSAVADLLDHDEEFHLFSHARSDEDVVVVAEPSRNSAPLALEDARAEMDMLLHRFLYILDARDRRGRVVYLGFDGDYGLVQPW